MTLYHFTDRAAAESILREGLTKGMVCLGFDEEKEAVVFLKQTCQWLTDLRSMKGTGLVESYRNVRLTVDIPEGDGNLLSPRQWRKLILPKVMKGYKGIYSMPVNNHFWLYTGTIPPEWIRDGQQMAGKWPANKEKA